MTDVVANLSLDFMLTIALALVVVILGAIVVFRSPAPRRGGLLAVVLLVAAARPAGAADRIALTSIVAASVADAVTTERAIRSTPGAYEANPILHGAAVQREATKAATTAALVWGLARVGERHPRIAAVLAWTAAGSLAALAAHNAQIGGR